MRAVISAADVPDVRYGGGLKDEMVFAKGKVGSFIGNGWEWPYVFNPKGGAAPKSFEAKMGAYPMPSHIKGRYMPTFLVPVRGSRVMTASAVPMYHWFSETRWLAGRMSKLSLRSGRRKFHARCMWRIRLCALYCVATAMRRIAMLPPGAALVCPESSKVGSAREALCRGVSAAAGA